jgi:3-deoxy-manno-octulosonate cytidylyltransferase (CMP-KDO synthetase)
MKNPRIAAIIPTRMASSRFPGKPLLRVRGLPMIEHVRRRVLLCEDFDEVVVATCDTEIAEAVKASGGRVIMTSPSHPGATDRVAEAAGSLNCSHIINVQGDEILILPEDLSRMIAAIRSQPEGKTWNAVAPLEEAPQLKDRSIVKCIISTSGRILSCSRDYSNVPLKAPFEPLRIILGILAYEKNFLMNFSKLQRTPYETAESIDQSRIVEHDIVLQGVPFTRGYPGINEPREVEQVEHFLNNDPRQKDLLSQILTAAPVSL